jgi:hypothetical protein
VGHDQIYELCCEQLPRQFQVAEVTLGPRPKRAPLYIAALHHHLYMPDPLHILGPPGPPPGSVSVLTDGPEVIETMLELGFAAILHGHAHSAFHTHSGQAKPFESAGDVPGVLIAGTGTLGLGRDDVIGKRNPHQFQVIDFGDDRAGKTEVTIRAYRAESVSPGAQRSWQKSEFRYLLPTRSASIDSVVSLGSGGRSRRERAEAEWQQFRSLLHFEALLKDEPEAWNVCGAAIIRLAPGRRITSFLAQMRQWISDMKAKGAENDERAALKRFLLAKPGTRLEHFVLERLT